MAQHTLCLGFLNAWEAARMLREKGGGASEPASVARSNGGAGPGTPGAAGLPVRKREEDMTLVW
jgi:hypothetical protein